MPFPLFSQANGVALALTVSGHIRDLGLDGAGRASAGGLPGTALEETRCPC